ncbi:phosphatase PAP2 family protein [Telluria aromaticivorans]|uniref:Phosphatase PAP2 family protein n=1 Tax=Telluria aromaticivorans TaxID=2725995 RepID=A0A7Y2NYQ9_9BURK|nr:phosphatase PAP2 family protein [Telluria aromaticivorans]NNG22318.1 phosphatase PAP2 family protein [Telluria aromaticivorans]
MQAQHEAAILLETGAAIRIGALLALAGLLIFALGRYTNIDLVLADALYDAAAGAFPWRDAWLTDILGHRILKTALTVLAALHIAAALGDATWPQAVLDRPLARLRLHVIAWSAALVPLAISLLKQGSNAHCPWDLARYGGSQPYVRLFEALPAGALPGHCLPAGHASSALWLVSLAVLWLPDRARRAWRAAGAAIALGTAVGWMQQMRGAHFLTHTLWSVWIACAIVLALVMLLQSRPWPRGRPNGGRPLRVPAGTRWRAR